MILASGVRNTFAYDGDGKRIKKEDSSGTSKFVWDGENILLETNASDVIQAVYSMEPVLYGNLISQYRSAASSFFHFSALGSTDRLTDAAATVTDSYVYDAFGRIKAMAGGTTNRFKYVGQIQYFHDSDILAYNARARIYDPITGRFLSQDPVAYRGGMDIYVYLLNSPLNRVDPLGQGEKPINPKPPSPGPPWPKPGDIPGDIEDDNKDECIFECKGSPPPISKPKGRCCRGIAGPEDLLKQCEKLKKNCSRITVGGHGVAGGIGVMCLVENKWWAMCFGCNKEGKPSRCFHQILGCFKGLLAPSGYLRICSCKWDVVDDADTECIKNMKAALGGAKVCFCKGSAGSEEGKYCVCGGEWVCM